MDVREKLVELLKEIVAIQECGFGDPRPTYETVASYLMYHGVMRWIPVTEKIPPDQEEVLVLTKSKNGVRNVDKGYWAIDHFIHRGRAQVTHWMPLPNPPKGE